MSGLGLVIPIALTGGVASPYTSSAPIFELQTSATDYVLILEISLSLMFSNTAASSAVVAVGIPAAQGVGVNASTALYDDIARTDNIPGLSVLTYWNKLPTVPTNFLRRVTHQGARNTNWVNQPVIFRFQRGLKLAQSSSLVVWFLGATFGDAAVFDPNIVVDG